MKRLARADTVCAVERVCKERGWKRKKEGK
jgi:hypothetical protein